MAEEPEWCRISLYAELDRKKFEELEVAIENLLCEEEGLDHECEFPWVMASAFPEREKFLIERAEEAVTKARSVYGSLGEFGARLVLKAVLGTLEGEDGGEAGDSEEGVPAGLGSDAPGREA